jgi:hypothetical protein
MVLGVINEKKEFMKRIILAVTAIVGVIFTAQAQGGLKFGIKAGANLNMIDGQAFSETFDLTYHLGGFAEINFNKKWGIQPELLWNQTSGNTSTFNSLYATVSNPNATQNIKLNYLSIPVLLRYNVNKLVSLNLGPQFGILLKDESTLLLNGQSAFKNGDFSMVGGVQLNFALLRIYGRYNVGLMNINDIDNKDKWTNQQLQFGIGLRL